MFKIIFKRSAEKDLRRLSPEVRKRIFEKIERIASNPRAPGIEKLRGTELWRVRVGDCRVVYEIRNDELLIAVIAAQHRSAVYQNL